ncbi:MAG: glycosyltransferase, partial [Acidobacteriota bacterium]
LILDDDMTLRPDALVGHVAAHTRRARAIIGRIEPDPNTFHGPFGAFLADEELARHARLAASAENVAFTDCLTGHFSIRRDLLRAVGGYQARFSRYGFEDIELAWRLIHRGIRLAYRERLVAVHRSPHANFTTVCRRHREVGAMAVTFASAHQDEAVRAFLRLDGMRGRREPTPFRRAMSAAHTTVRSLPRGPREVLLAAARAAVAVLERIGPRRFRHAAYHIVRDMHYAAGIAEARR